MEPIQFVRTSSAMRFACVLKCPTSIGLLFLHLTTPESVMNAPIFTGRPALPLYLSLNCADCAPNTPTTSLRNQPNVCLPQPWRGELDERRRWL